MNQVEQKNQKKCNLERMRIKDEFIFIYGIFSPVSYLELYAFLTN